MTYSGVLFSDGECCGYSYSGPVTARIFDKAEGADALWEETHAEVPVEQGYLSIELGSVVPLPVETMLPPLWLELELEGIGTLSPRVALTAVPFSVRAWDSERLGGKMADEFAAADHAHEGEFVKPGEAGAVTEGMVADGAVGLQGLSADGCIADNVLRRDAVNSSWVCGPDNDTIYVPGVGLALAPGNVLDVDQVAVELWATGVCYDSPDELYAELDGRYSSLGHDHDTSYVQVGAEDAVSTAMLQDGSVTLEKLGNMCVTGQVLRKTATGWACSDAAQGTTLSNLVCAAGQVPQFDGSKWACSDSVPKPPKCEGPLAGLQFDGTSWSCVQRPDLVSDSWGFIWDDQEHYATSWANANAACKGRGGRLPTVTELFRVSAAVTGEVGTPYNSNYLWAGIKWHPGQYTIVRLTDGSIGGDVANSARPYRCVFPNTSIFYFAGNNCYGAPGFECYAAADPKQRYNIDARDRPPVTWVAASDECAFYHAFVATAGDFARLVAREPGLPNGSNQWLWTADTSRYDAADLVRWNNVDLAYNAAGSYVNYAGKQNVAYRFRCIGVNYAAGAHPNVIEGEFVAESTYLKADSQDRQKATLPDAITTCFQAAGHLPSERDYMVLIRAGMPNGPAAWEWTSDASHYVYNQVVLWKGADLDFADYYPQWATWTDRKPPAAYPYRCVYNPIDPQYLGPPDGKCNVGAPCFTVERGAEFKATMWADSADRVPANFITAVQECYGAGGRLASFRDMIELVRAGLPTGVGTWLWTTDAAGDNGATVMVVKWTGADLAFDGSNPNYATWSDKSPATVRPYRCVWTNEL